MARKKLNNFDQKLTKTSKDLTKQLVVYLKKIELALERQGKKNATDDFYQAKTRSGKTRSYKLTGRLRNSINAVSKADSDGVTVSFSAGFGKGSQFLVYAAPLEFGNRSKTILPYFFMGRAMQKIQQSELNKELTKFLRIELQDL